MRLGILTSHPIQYQAPWFRALAGAADVEVFFAHRQTAAEQGKAGYGVAFEWDVDLLAGYRHRFLRNVAARPGVNDFSGCDTPELRDLMARVQRLSVARKVDISILLAAMLADGLPAHEGGNAAGAA